MHLCFPKHGMLKKLYLRGEPFNLGTDGMFEPFGNEAAAVVAACTALAQLQCSHPWTLM